MGNKKKNIARSFKFLWATFFKTMGNEFHSDGQRILRLRAMLFHHLTEQRSGGSSCDLHLDKLPHMKILFIENHHLILAGAPKQLLSGTFREAFNQHLKGLSNVSTITLLRQLVLQIDHSLQTTDLLLFRHIIW